MSNENKKSGRCLCGSVKFYLQEAVTRYGVCHCDMCRRWASGPYFASDCGTNVIFEGEKNITRYRSSDWGERGFCKNCGSNLFYYVVPTGQYNMAIGAFNDQDGLDLDSQIFIDEKPDSYDFSNETATMTGAEVFAFYAPKE